MPAKQPHITRTTEKDDYETPQLLFDKLDKVFRFNCDMAATPENTKCSVSYGCSLSVEWSLGFSIFCNPPFSNKEAFLRQAVKYRNANQAIVFLLPNNARGTEWWRKYVLQSDLIINLYPRVNYWVEGKEVKGVGFESAAIVFYPRLEGGEYGLPNEVYWNWRE